jgi:hypothetical protein
MGTRTGTKQYFEVAMSTLARAITSGSVYATERAAILADASTILFGKSADAGKGLRLGAMLEIDPSGEIMFDGVPEDKISVDFTTMGYDATTDAAARAALWAKKGVRQYFYFMDERTETIERVGLMMPNIKKTSKGGEVEIFQITASEAGAESDLHLEKQFGTGVTTPYIQITAPNTAIVVGQGDTVTITWRANFTDAVKIELFKGASLDTTINAGIGAMAGTYAWVVPADQATGTDYSIKITRVAGTAATDESDVDFEIEA